MLSFNDFAKELLIIESIKYMDKTLFKNIIDGKYDPYKNKNNNLIKEDKTESELESDLNDADDTSRYDDYLSNDEEIELIKIYQKNPDSQEGRVAMNKLVENKMRYIYKNVGKFIGANPQYSNKRDDLVQDASLALIKAIDAFDPNQGTIFTAFAKKYINGAILNSINPIRNSSLDGGRSGAGVSIDSKVSGSRGTFADKDMTVGDLIPDTSLESNPLLKEIDDEQRALLNDWINRLPDIEKTAITMRFLTDEGATFEEIAKKVGMTTMGAKKLVDRVVKKLRLWAEEAGVTN